MVNINPTISIITLNVNDLNMSVKKQRLSEWVNKQDSTVYCLQDADQK